MPRSRRSRPRRRQRSRPDLSDRARQAEVFLTQAEHCRVHLRSPLYAELCERCATDTLVGEVAPDLRWDLPLRLLGALHYLALAGRSPELARSYDWPAFRTTLERERGFVAEFLRVRSVQTNEVQRCFTLLPAFLEVARTLGRRLALVELGPSAGLNLLWDRYGYRYGDEDWGSPESVLRLDGELRAPLPEGLLRTEVEVVARTGIDLHPLDPTDPETSLLLRCFVWADQPDRLARVERALEIARREPPQLLRGDYVDVLPEVLAARDRDTLTVVFETASLIYLSRERQRAVHESLESAGEQAPLAFVWTSDPDEWGLRARMWPGGQTRLLARTDGHGAWLEWLT